MKRIFGWFLLAMVTSVGWASGQMAWTNIAILHQATCTADIQARWSLCGLFIINEHNPRPNGGPQGLEGYTIVSHPVGTVGLAIATIGNFESAGNGRTIRAVSLAGGGVLSGNGVVEHWSGLSLSVPRPSSGSTGRVDRADYITFDNGWSIRPDGANLSLCGPSGMCRRF